MKNIKYLLFISILLFLIPLTSCSSDDDSSTSSSSSSSLIEGADDAFPVGLAVTSPFESSEAVNTAIEQSVPRQAGLGSSYAWITAQIEVILATGSTPGLCTFDPDLFFRDSTDADCYGPNVDYQDHPDASTPNSGQLPSGDLGLWDPTDTSTGDACAVAEINAKMEGFRDQSLAAMSSIAMMICNANLPLNSNWPVLPGTTLDLLTQPSPPIEPDCTFNTATIECDASGTVWKYILDFSYDDGTTVHHIYVNLCHESVSTGVYKGRFSYYFTDLKASVPGMMCQASSDVTVNCSLVYDRTSTTAMNLQSRNAVFCGYDATGFDSNGVVGNTQEWDGSSGWTDNFTIFTAEFDPTNLTGIYLYAWQAGYDDDISRIFNFGINNHTPIDGEAWFGFGDDIASSSWSGTNLGNIEGFICNYAGPGGQHPGAYTLQNLAQRQFVEENSLGVIEPTDSDILYAPCNSCQYDGSGSFVYDRDHDGSLLDESDATNVVTDPVTTGLEFNLYEPIGAYTGWDIGDVISARVSHPSVPSVTASCTYP